MRDQGSPPELCTETIVVFAGPKDDNRCILNPAEKPKVEIQIIEGVPNLREWFP
jgi:hypothetical protein